MKKLLERMPDTTRETVRITVTDAWNHPLLGCLLLGALGGEWWLRRRSGLA
jgi:hypothetical protein